MQKMDAHHSRPAAGESATSLEPTPRERRFGQAAPRDAADGPVRICPVCARRKGCLFGATLGPGVRRGRWSTVTLDKGAIIYSAGLPADAVYALCMGSVRLECVLSGRSRRTAAFLGAPVVFGLEALFQRRRTFDAVARESVRLAMIEADALREMCRCDGAFALGMATLLARQMTSVHEQFVIATERPALTALELILPKIFCRAQPEEVAASERKLTQREIACFLGVSEENLSRGKKRQRENGGAHASA